MSQVGPAAPNMPSGRRLNAALSAVLDFFARFDGGPGRIKWPHVSINTLEKRTGEVDTSSYAPTPAST